jgi:sugar phosphate isomerase/epimerase
LRSPLKFAAFADIAPGNSLTARCEAIAGAGCRGLETLVYPTTSLEAWQQEVKQATTQAGIEPVAVILGGGLDLYRPDKLGWVREALPAIAEVGAAAMLTPEYRAQDPLPLFPPYPLPPRAELVQVERAIGEISELAGRLALPVYFEPVTQFESRFWREVEPVRAICQTLNTSWVKLCLDFHNMNITEASLIATLRRAGPWIGHIHLADNNRRLPGQGHLDFTTGLAILGELGYTGWYSFECGVEGDFQTQVQSCITYLNGLISRDQGRSS